ncbi:MAG: T9SS type A sorting domain-containing protein [Bacteroidota bacterium]
MKNNATYILRTWGEYLVNGLMPLIHMLRKSFTYTTSSRSLPIQKSLIFLSLFVVVQIGFANNNLENFNGFADNAALNAKISNPRNATVTLSAGAMIFEGNAAGPDFFAQITLDITDTSLDGIDDFTVAASYQSGSNENLLIELIDDFGSTITQSSVVGTQSVNGTITIDVSSSTSTLSFVRFTYQSVDGGPTSVSFDDLTLTGEQGQPQNLTISDVSSTGFTLNWDALTGASGVNVFIVDVTNGSGDVYITTLSGDATSYEYSGTEATITITDGIQYEAKIQALPDAVGGDGFAALTVTAEDVDEQGAPTGLTATAISGGSFTLSWDALTNASGINVFISEPGGATDLFVTTIDRDATSYTYMGTLTQGAKTITIEDGGTYVAKIQALPDGDGNAFADLQVTNTPTTDPDPPTGLTTTNITNTGFTLEWDDTPGATNFNIFIVDVTNSSGDVFITTVDGDVRSFDYSGTYGSTTITAGNTYQAKIQALPDGDSNAFADTEVTLPVDATFLEQSAPTNLILTQLSELSFTMEWDVVTGSSGTNVFIARPGGEDVLASTLAAGVNSFKYEGTYGDITIGPDEEFIAKIQLLPDGNSDAFAQLTVETDPVVLSVNEGGANLAITVLPNPVVNELRIINESNVNLEQATLLTSAGKVLKHYQISGKGDVLSVQNLPNGLYFLSVRDENDQVVTVKRFIKN